MSSITEKVAPETVESVNEGLEDGALTEHDGTERLVRNDADAFDSGPLRGE
ncbi:hypothetical protein [Natronomonas sp. LN261]|uniref:hypothetical protein n=1 Tax=Natronomonas sp. LN261 TaxID=2750669 RepID=UPI0021084B97|nr:hypothetical protein [Natronomonas sp. LN261]